MEFCTHLFIFVILISIFLLSLLYLYYIRLRRIRFNPDIYVCSECIDHQAAIWIRRVKSKSYRDYINKLSSFRKIRKIDEDFRTFADLVYSCEYFSCSCIQSLMDDWDAAYFNIPYLKNF